MHVTTFIDHHAPTMAENTRLKELARCQHLSTDTACTWKSPTQKHRNASSKFLKLWKCYSSAIPLPAPLVAQNRKTSVKLDFPCFDGTNLLDWIFKANHFFDYYKTPDYDRLSITSVHLDHYVIPWFQMLQKAHPFQTWKEFARALKAEFSPSAYEWPRATLFKLTEQRS